MLCCCLYCVFFFFILIVFFFFFFFFQAEDGIRDKLVTGVQMCALPISTVFRSRPGSAYRRIRTPCSSRRPRLPSRGTACRGCRSSTCRASRVSSEASCNRGSRFPCRSEERRVGKECRAGGSSVGREETE